MARIGFVLSLLGLLSLLSVNSSAASTRLTTLESPYLFFDKPVEILVTDTEVLQSKAVDINFGLLNTIANAPATLASSSVQIPLFDGTTLSVMFDQLDKRSSNSFVLSGTVMGYPLSQVAVSVEQETITGYLVMDDLPTYYELRYSEQGVHLFQERRVSSEQDKEESSFPLSWPILTDPHRLAPGSSVGGNHTIDIMVVYTPRARQNAGGQSAIEGLINLAISQANQSFANSQINVQLNLVHSAEVSYTEAPSSAGSAEGLGADLARLAQPDDGFIDYIHAWRDSYHADIVSLIVESNSSYYGIGDQPGEFSVVQRQRAVAPYYTFTHEVGHNVDGDHDRGFVGSSYRTIMSLQAGLPRIPHFSNPNVLYNGQDTGDADHNNAARINARAPITAEARRASPERCYSVGTLFCDVPVQHWAYDEINSLYDRLTRGCESGQMYEDLPYCPEDNLSRAHMAVFLVRHVHGNNINYQPSGPYNGYFSDVPASHPLALWVEELYELGLTSGSTNCPGTGLRFCPDSIITRSEIATFLMRTEYYLGRIPDYTTLPSHNVFRDVPVDNVHRPAIEYMYWRGFTNGAACVGEDFTFCPDSPVNRAQAAVFMARVFGFVSVFAPDPYEGNNTASVATLLEAGQPQIHSIVPATDEDWLTFSLNTESDVTLFTYGGDDDTRMWVYNSTLQQLAYDDDGGDNRFSRLSFSCQSNPLAPGTYYIKLDEYGNNNSIARYGVRLSSESCQSAGDTYEPDNSSGSANLIASHTSQTHSIVPAQDVDWVWFTLSESREVTLETSGPSGDTRMWLYDQDLNPISFDDDSGTDYFSRIHHSCTTNPLPAGTYYVKVDEYNNDQEIASYTLQLITGTTCQTAPTPKPIWRILYLIYPSIDVSYQDQNGNPRHLTYTLSETEIADATHSFRRFPAIAHDFSNEEAVIEYDVVRVTRPLTSLTPVDNWYWVSPNDTRAELDLYAPQGTYDSVLVLWPQTNLATNQQIPSGGWGLAIGPSSWANGATYATVANARTELWMMPTVGEVWLHEWLHGVTDFYTDQGFTMPQGGPDGGSSHGYTWSPETGWAAFYRDLMTGQVLEQGVNTGITAQAWRTGTILSPESYPVLLDYFANGDLSEYQITGSVTWDQAAHQVQLGHGANADNKLYTTLPFSGAFEATGRLFISSSPANFDSVALALRGSDTEYWLTLAYGTDLIERNHIAVIHNNAWGEMAPLYLSPGWYTLKVRLDPTTHLLQVKAWGDHQNETDWQLQTNVPSGWYPEDIGFRHFGPGTAVDDLFAYASPIPVDFDHALYVPLVAR